MPGHEQPGEGETRTETLASELRSVDGPAQAGDYVSITIFGAVQVKVDSVTSIEAGQRLTFAANGRARPVGTIKVQLAGGEGTADIPESAPVIGVALEAAKDGMVGLGAGEPAVAHVLSRPRRRRGLGPAPASRLAWIIVVYDLNSSTCLRRAL